jgi:hypothetical protein
MTMRRAGPAPIDMRIRVLLWVLAIAVMSHGYATAQTDTTVHGWPVTPFFLSHPSTGTFCEFRNTLSSDHFHNGLDIAMPDGTPVYPVYNGTVTSIGTTASSGTSAYVRVRYTVSGYSKSDAYVHIEPNPGLRVGDPVVAHQTVLGTILPGLGHVHFTNGLSGSEINALRPVGGFTPYLDAYPPEIVSVRLLVDGQETGFLNGRVSGRVDIRVHVRETSASRAAELSSSTTNNGTYLIGYTILSADRSTVVYEPPSSGVRFRFDRKPYDADVHNVFATGSDLSTHIYTVTNGNGADAINATRSVPNGFWDTEALPAGPYTVMVFTEDTRGWADTEYVAVTVERSDLLPPATPVLRAVMNDSTNRVTISWYPNTEGDLLGYRLYFSTDGTSWTQRDNETRLGRGVSSISYDNIRSGRIFFRIVAVDSASPTNVSPYSDIYGLRLNSSSDKTLIVDGFDRTELSGSSHASSHPHAMTHGLSVSGDFESCANDALIDGTVSLAPYARVLWVLGDESTEDETFSPGEQGRVLAYLRQGGNLFVSGSEIGSDLDQGSGPTQADRDFLHTFLKCTYIADDANEYTVTGNGATAFSGITLRYGIVSEGSPYEEDRPDVLSPLEGAQSVLLYNAAGTGGTAGIAFQGVFPGGTAPGAVVTLAFPFETIVNQAQRDSLMARVFALFGGVTAATPETGVSGQPLAFGLLNNYPNPFNPSTTIRYALDASEHVRLQVFDALGRVVATLVDEQQVRGTYARTWLADGMSSGIYYCRLSAGSRTHSLHMVLIR